jgi:arginase
MNVAIIGVPYALDEPNVGPDNAPDALLDAGLAQRLEAQGCETILAQQIDIPPSSEPREQRLGQLFTRLGHEVARARAGGFFPVVLGGDCMTSLGTLAGLLDPESTGVVWCDAHGDFNTPEISPSGYLGGMPLACATGRTLDTLREQSKLTVPLPERNVLLIGANALDPLEERALVGSSVRLVRAADLDGDRATLDRALHDIGVLPQVYLHIDIDVVDPSEAPGVNYPAAGGLRVEQMRAIVRAVAGMGNLAALALTAVRPEKDSDGRTVRAALDLIEEAVVNVQSTE